MEIIRKKREWRISKPSKEEWSKMSKKEKQTFYNRARSSETLKEYNQTSHKINPERRKLNHKKYYTENKEYCSNKTKEWKINNPDYKEKQNEKMRKWRLLNPEKIKTFYRKGNLKKFGLTIEDYNSMFSEHQGCCKICGIHESKLLPKSKLGIDHCHNTNKIRGLLCTNCNTGLGQFKDNIFIMKKAIDYLQNNSL